MTLPETRPDKDPDEYNIATVNWDTLRAALEKPYPSNVVTMEVKLRLLEKASDERVMESNKPLPRREDMGFGEEGSELADGFVRS
jgi:hypothetical protein